MAIRRNSHRGKLPDLALLEDVVASKVLHAMRVASEQLSRAGIRHALVGALAVGAHGYPRATKDVDFLVGEEAFEHHAGGLVTIAPGVPVQVGSVGVDPVQIAPDEAHLAGVIEAPLARQGIPIAPLGTLVYLKLRSPRRRDSADLVELFKTGFDENEVRLYLARHAPDLLNKFGALFSEAIREQDA